MKHSNAFSVLMTALVVPGTAFAHPLETAHVHGGEGLSVVYIAVVALISLAFLALVSRRRN